MSTLTIGAGTEATGMTSNLNGVQSVPGVDLGAASYPSTTIAVPQVNFTLFPKLPLELQRKIWREAITPRIIYILKDDSAERLTWKAITSSTIALLSVNAESRSEALKMYEKPFNKHGIPGQESDCHGPCYVNFAQDLIYINFIHLNFCFNMIFVDGMLPQDRFMNVALDMTSLECVKDELLYIVHDKENPSPLGTCVWTWDKCKLRLIKELVVVVGHIQDRNNPKKILLSEKTSRATPVKKSTEAAFAEFKTRFPNVVLPELSTCYELLGAD
ncbi:hypothetical protein DL98DRAFT_651251 [Cadophora sp. DSE1049]|nr:hypothetical protein DL98DRAFT_651251 [Cadophora sp. DSE1049]